MTKIIKKARDFAKKAHEGQLRKGDGQPFFNHPQAVYEIAKTVTNDESILAACYLHDTIEDTPTTYEDLVKAFNKEIADIVEAVSEDKTVSWEEAKEKYLGKVFSNEKAIIVAWADKMHNTQDLVNVTNFSVFKRPLKQKIDFYSKFAELLSDEDLKTRLKLVIDTVFDIVYTVSE